MIPDFRIDGKAQSDWLVLNNYHVKKAISSVSSLEMLEINLRIEYFDLFDVLFENCNHLSSV